MDILFSILTANIIVSLLSFIGVFTIGSTYFKTKQSTNMLVSFAAGVLLATAFLDILPEALENLEPHGALSWAMMGMIAAFFMERSLLWYHHHHDDSHDLQPKTVLILIGDALHNFIDGLAISAAFIVNPALGVSTVLAIIAHEIPQELADFSILRHCGMNQSKALTWNFLSALTSLIGGLVGFYFFKDSPAFTYSMLGFTGGLFIYISSADLIPELHQTGVTSGWFGQSVMFLCGVGIIILSGMMGH